MKKKAILILGLGIILFLGYNYIYQDHRIIENEEPEFIVSSDSLFEDFTKRPKHSEAMYLDQTIEINGMVTEVNNHDLTLDDKIFCKFIEINGTINLNDKIRLKGRCIGYDDLLEQVKLDQCNLIE